jgi:hypothetical protein
MADPKKPPGSSGGTYRYVGTHASMLESGAPLGMGDYVELDSANLSPHDQALIDEGWLIDATGSAPQATEEEVKE